jgi:hypothetical protein
MDHKDLKVLAAEADSHWGLHESQAALMPLLPEQAAPNENIITV